MESIKTILNAMKGNHRCMSRLYLSYAGKVLFLCRRLTKDEALAQEAFLKTFSAVWNREDTGYNPKSKPFSVLLGNRAVSFCTSNPGGAPLKDPEQDPACTFVIHMLDTMPERQCAAVLLYYVCGMSILQTAQALGVKPNLAKSALDGGILSLKRKLAEEKKRNPEIPFSLQLEIILEKCIRETCIPEEANAEALAEISAKSIPFWKNPMIIIACCVAIAAAVSIPIFTLSAGKSSSLSATDYSVEGDYSYILLDDGSAEIYSYTGDSTAPVIPDTLGSCPVTEIGSSAFSGNSTIASVSLPATLEKIGINAFSDCTGINAVIFRGSLSQWDTVSVSSGNDALLNATFTYASGDSSGTDLS